MIVPGAGVTEKAGAGGVLCGVTWPDVSAADDVDFFFFGLAGFFDPVSLTTTGATRRSVAAAAVSGLNEL